MRAGLGIGPRKGVDAEPDAGAHQLVPGGVELDLVDAVSEAVMGNERGLVLVRLAAPFTGLRGAGERADLRDPVLGPVAALAPKRLDENAVRLEDVVVLERRGLVQNLVGGVGCARFDGRHGPLNGTRSRGSGVASGL